MLNVEDVRVRRSKEIFFNF